MDSKTIRICKTCNMGYILPYGGHEVCEGCLGHEHAVLALSPLCLCRHCAALPLDVRQRRADTAAAIAEQADDVSPGLPTPNGEGRPGVHSGFPASSVCSRGRRRNSLGGGQGEQS